MKKKTFTIPIYDFDVTLIEVEGEDDKEQVVEVEDRLLEWVGVHDIEESAYLAGFLSKFMY